MEDRRPIIVVTPSSVISYEIKERWVAECAGGVGVHFWTPGDLRQYLMRLHFPGQTVASREVLHLLLSQSAEACGGRGVAASVAVDSAGLMRALDDLAAAGWEWDELPGGSDVRAVVAEFRRRLGDSGFWMAQGCDWALAKATATGGAAPARALLLHGFTGANWSLWPLLLAGVRSADDVVVTLACPRRQAERVDQIWISSWEEHLGLGVQELEVGSRPCPFGSLAECLEAGDLVARGLGAAVPEFEIGEDAAAEARAITGRVMEWLGSVEGGRLAVVFPRAGVLSREVGSLLGALGVPHDDMLGFPAGHQPDESAWREWLGLQADWTAVRLAHLLAKCPQGPWAAAAAGAGLMDRLERMMGTTLADDLDVLRAALGASRHGRDREALASLDGVVRVPELGPFDGLVAAAVDALDRLGWRARAAALRSRARPLAGRIQGEVRRRHFLGWAEAALGASGRERGAGGREPYARVHLVLAREAEAQSWDRVILAGMNEGEWPRVTQAGPFLPEAARTVLNRRAVIVGSQGEGHEAVVQGRGLMLGEADWRYVGLRQCFNLIEGARAGLCMTARLRGEEDPGRLLGPSDLLVKAHYVATGEMLTDQRMGAMSRLSASRWSGSARLICANGEDRPWPCAGPAEVRAAWDARRHRDAPFGPYDFCLRRAPEVPVHLACRSWEDAWRFPATTWLREVVGAEPIRELGESDVEAQSLGTWAHEWLARALNPEKRRIFVPAPATGAALSAVGAAAEASRAGAAVVFRSAGRELPALWDAVWRRALWAARVMCEEALGDGGGYLGTEWDLPEGCEVDLGDGARLRLRGRVDLIRTETPNFGGPVSVIDFKTGADVTLTPAEIEKGKGLQVVLYGEALRELGASAVWLRIVRPTGGGSAREISRQDVIGLLRSLSTMQDSGAFGVRGEMFSEFAYRPQFPMATLPVPADTNDGRWELTRGGRGRAEE